MRLTEDLPVCLSGEEFVRESGMGPFRRGFPVAALFAVFFPAAVGVVAVHASPTCERFVRNYVTVPVRNRVSKATVAAWAKWRVGHPEWKPNPRVTRPKYVMTRKEAVDKVAFACEVPTTPAMTDALLTPSDLILLPPAQEIPPPIETTDVTSPGLIPPVETEAPPPPTLVSGLTPPPVFVVPPFIPPVYGGGSPPVVVKTPGSPTTPTSPTSPTSPNTPVVPTPVPEPSGFVLLASGLVGVGLIWRRRVTA